MEFHEKALRMSIILTVLHPDLTVLYVFTTLLMVRSLKRVQEGKPIVFSNIAPFPIPIESASTRTDTSRTLAGTKQSYTLQ